MTLSELIICIIIIAILAVAYSAGVQDGDRLNRPYCTNCHIECRK
jgi:prepilin-type N-terminal cleavage/methylation domain-containing protein